MKTAVCLGIQCVYMVARAVNPSGLLRYEGLGF